MTLYYIGEKLKASVCHSLFTSGIRSPLEEPPQCLGERCSSWFLCVRDGCEALHTILELEEQESATDIVSEPIVED